VVLLSLANALNYRRVGRRCANDHVDVLTVEANYCVLRRRAGIGSKGRHAIGRRPGGLALARCVADIRAEPPPTTGERARAGIGVAGIDADAEARVVAGVL